MLRISRVVAVALLVLGLGLGCASTHFVSTWTDPSLEGPVSLTGKRVATFLLSDEESTRRMVEDILAGEVTSHGAEGVPGFTLMSADEALDQDWVRERLNAEGIEGAVIMRLIGRETERATGGRAGPWCMSRGIWRRMLSSQLRHWSTR